MRHLRRSSVPRWESRWIAAIPAHAAPINFVQNGDFRLGNTGFYSGYAFHDNDDGGVRTGELFD